MQFSLVAFASLIAAVAAQNGVPACAAGCVKNLPTECATQDIACICGDSSFITNVSCCVYQNCAQSDQAAALAFALNICQAGGVSLTNTAATCLSTSTSSSSSSKTAVPASTTSSSQSSSASTSSSATSATTGAGVGTGSTSETSAATGTSSTGSATAGTATTSGSSTAGTSTAGTSSSSSVSAAGAPKITAMAGFFGAAAAAIALL